MSSLNAAVFTTIPAIALIFNIFLFSTLLTAKKDKAVYSFMTLLLAFILWTGGSLFMRMGMRPDPIFWWKVSLAGLFLVPYLLYLLACNFSEQKGYFLKILLGLATGVVVILNFFNVFLTSPEFTLESGHKVVHYSATMWALIPVVLDVFILIMCWAVLFRSVKKYGVPISYYTPLFIGVVIMFVGVFLDLVPMFNSMPFDTLGCALNAICIYYAFCKKRVYSLHQITSRGAMYVVSIIIIGVTTPAYVRIIERLNLTYTPHLVAVSILIYAIIAISLFILLNKLNDGVFVKEQNRRTDTVKEFSDCVNSTLNEKDILNRFLEICREEVPTDHLYVCMFNKDADRYESLPGIDSLEMPIMVQRANPIIEYLQMKNGGIVYQDFKRHMLYRSMWEDEKETLEFLKIAYILPFKDERNILGFALFTNKAGNKAFGYNEINFLESIANVTTIALKNAHLYSELEREAQLDTLTTLYNRRTFNRKMNEIIEEQGVRPVSLILFNLDDFGLYNELYGNEEGDIMLQKFAGILNSVFGSGAVLSRYNGNEYMALMPATDADTAMRYAERVKEQLACHIESGRENTKKFLTFSAAICAYPAVASNANELITYVNLAMFHIKHSGKNQIMIYHAELQKGSGEEDKAENIYELTSTIFALTAAIDAKDHYTFNHSRCVSEYATQLATCAGLPADYVEIIRQAGLLHDIGKIGIPDAILTKQGKLTDDEFFIMRQHVERSIEMIRHLPSLDYVIPAVVGHHERFDGSGYPRGISGEDIPIGARCLAIADSFDAMVSRRCYKDKMPLERALSEILGNLGTQFDPELGKLFVDKVRSGEISVIDY
ncbi:MAG: diguanylate cyclase [Lachnospiraceae bacterium]|nr:diguanylate cyclase [Lachnospiraceae bacterium]